MPRGMACFSYPRGIIAGVSDAGSEANGSIDYPDVRQYLAELLASGEPSLDEVDWGRFHHAYGAADDVPDLLRALSARDQQRASASLSTLWNLVCHQGGSSAPAALAVPFLLRAAAERAVRNRAQLLLLAAEAGHRNHFGRDRREDLLQVEYLPEEKAFDASGYPAQWTLQAARDALAAGAPLLIELLDDPDRAVRAHAAYALATAASPPSRARHELRERLAVEREPPVRISLVLAVTQLAVEQADDPGIVAWARQLWTGQGNAADVRLAVALAWLCATQARPPTALLDLLTALAGAPAAQWLQDVPWPDDIGYHGGLAAWLVSFLGDDPEAQARLTRSLIAQPDHIVAASACRAAHDVARVWRTRTEEMLDLLAGCLGHRDRTVRGAAIRLLARGGAVPARAADPVAAVFDDNDPELRAWAAATLAHRGDARAVAPLTELLTRAECPWPCAWTESSAPPQRLLDMLGPHAGALLPAVTYRLAQPETGCWRHVSRDLLHGLATWHNQAADAAVTLTDLLARPGEDQHTIATILGRIGPAATIAVPVLDELLANADPKLAGVLAWARWRITGEQTAQTARTLAVMTGTPPHGPEGLRLLADLGPAAAAHAPMIRASLTDSYEWVRAEAAHALWRCTGDTASTVPVLVRLLDGYPWLRMFAPVHRVVVECLGHIGTPAEPAAPILIRYLEADQRRDYRAQRHDPISWDQPGQRLAATALTRIRPLDPKIQAVTPPKDKAH
jgi:HEAT repeat protein